MSRRNPPPAAPSAPHAMVNAAEGELRKLTARIGLGPRARGIARDVLLAALRHQAEQWRIVAQCTPLGERQIELLDAADVLDSLVASIRAAES